MTRPLISAVGPLPRVDGDARTPRLVTAGGRASSPDGLAPVGTSGRTGSHPRPARPDTIADPRAQGSSVADRAGAQPPASQPVGPGHHDQERSRGAGTVRTFLVAVVALLALTGCQVRKVEREVATIDGRDYLCSATVNQLSGNESEPNCVPVVEP